MALGSNHITTTTAANFIPELWSDEVVAAYKQNLVAAQLVRKLNHRGKRGDTIHVPNPSRGTPSRKVAQTQVNLITETAGVIDISINLHTEYSRFIEDIVNVQALESMRRFYTDDGGYAIARDVDQSLYFELAKGGNAATNAVIARVGASGATIGSNVIENAAGGTTQEYWTTGDATDWVETGAGTAVDITQAGVLSFIKSLDNVDAPMANRALIIGPDQKEVLLGLAVFTEEGKVGERAQANSIRNGLIGSLYGVDVYVTNNLPAVEAGDASTDQELCFMIQQDAAVLVEQMGMRSQRQYKQEYLADLFTVDMLYGVKLMRPDSVIPFVTPTG